MPKNQAIDPLLSEVLPDDDTHIVETTVTATELAAAQGGYRPDQSTTPVWVVCPKDYDPDAITADDILNDGSIWAVSGPEMHCGWVTACGFRWVEGCSSTEVTCDECWSVGRDGDGCDPTDTPHDHLDNLRPWWAEQ